MVTYLLEAHIWYLPGEQNVLADQVSRWRKKGLEGFCAQNELVVTLKDILGEVWASR